jgi:hypothetical protein
MARHGHATINIARSKRPASARKSSLEVLPPGKRGRRHGLSRPKAGTVNTISTDP